MVKCYSADYVIPVNGNPIKNGVVEVGEDGVILGIYSHWQVPSDKQITRLSGVLIPGFVNAHCHLELSHMKDQIAPKTGLVKFIQSIMSSRDAEDDIVQKAMKEADELMYAQGIQAVGDHVNRSISSTIKSKSKIVYHTFVEILGLKEEEVENKIDEAREIEYYFDPKHSSITLHAPYSCNRVLFKAFKRSVSDNNIISIHNQESEEENKLFRYKTGDFLNFYKAIGYPFESLKLQAKNSLQSYFNLLPNNKIILVHNTFTSIKDLFFVQRMGKETYFCLCPKANLYIENTLPKLNVFTQAGVNLVLGTDSLASNNTLSILEELKVLHNNFKSLDFLETIRWATLNGAQALGLEENLGSIEVGKSPGLVLLKNIRNLKLTDKVEAVRIV